MPDLLVITNAAAGSAHDAAVDAAVATLKEQADVEVVATSSPDDCEAAVAGRGDRRVVVCGGDGSVHVIVAALHAADALGEPIGLIPLGTGNDFARGTGIPLDAEDAAHVLLDGKPRPMDLLVDEVGQVVVNSVHVGASAAASLRAHRWKDRLRPVGFGKVNLGRLGYPIGAAITAWNPPVLRLRVEVDGEVVTDLDTKVLMVALGNGSSVGGGTELTPDADPEDGRIDVLVSRATGPLSRLVYAARIGLGNHPDSIDVDTRRGRQVSVSGEAFWISADGEIDGPERYRSWTLKPAAYSMVLP